MTQRAAIALAAGVTAFVLVLTAGVAASLAGRPLDAQAAASRATGPVTPSVPVPQETPVPQESSTSQQSQPPAATASYPISADQAASIALAAIPNAQLGRPPELVSYQGTPVYEVELDGGLVYVDARSGRIVDNGAATVASGPGASPVTREQAIQAAVDYLGGGAVTRAELEEEHGLRVYEIKFRDGAEVYVDADTGQVVRAKRPESSPRLARFGDRQDSAREHEDGH